MRTEYKTTTWRHMKQGDVINYFKDGSTTIMGKYYVAEANVARITLWPVMVDGTYNHTTPRYCDPETFKLMVEMTDAELRDKYHSKAKEIVERLQRTVPLGDIGYHEMWNGWIGCDAYEFAQAADDEEFEINQEYINKSGIEFVDLPVEAEPEEPKKQEKKQPLLKRIGKYLLEVFKKLKNKLWR